MFSLRWGFFSSSFISFSSTVHTGPLVVHPLQGNGSAASLRGDTGITLTGRIEMRRRGGLCCRDTVDREIQGAIADAE